MRMIRSGFHSPAERREFESRVWRQRENHGIARRAIAILLLDGGESRTRIAKFLYLDDNAIRSWFKGYRQDSWEILALGSTAAQTEGATLKP